MRLAYRALITILTVVGVCGDHTAFNAVTLTVKAMFLQYYAGRLKKQSLNSAMSKIDWFVRTRLELMNNSLKEA